ncbi:MAG TPA: hypothetical protein VG815_06490 [Chloroflexota bacterium]|jgi:hypothetical protein|nr:hypothetical protein [Chloroflexota bacterium]
MWVVFSDANSPKLGQAVGDGASQSRDSLSSGISTAAADRLLNERLGEALEAWEAEAGALSENELRAAAERIASAPVSRPTATG